MKCLVYQTVTKEDGFIFHLFETEMGRRFYMTLRHNSDMGENQQDALGLNRRQYYIYGYAVNVLRTSIKTDSDREIATEDQDV